MAKGKAHGSGRTAYHPEDEQECRMSSHAQAKGTTRAVAVARASTGLTTHRPAGSRVRAWCQGSRDPSAGLTGKPVREPHDSTGEPGAGNRPAGFGERGEETYPWDSACGPVAKAPDKPPTPTGFCQPAPRPDLALAGGGRRGSPGRGRRRAGAGAGGQRLGPAARDRPAGIAQRASAGRGRARGCSPALWRSRYRCWRSAFVMPMRAILPVT